MKYKETGIEWFGIVPEHWKVNKLSLNVPFKTGFTPSTSKSEFYGGEHNWVTIDDLNGGIVTNTKTKLSNLGIDGRKGKLIKKGSLFYSFKLTVGKVGFAGEDMYTNEAIASFEPNDRIDINFLYYSFSDYLLNNAKENIYGAQLLNSELIKNSKILVPPKKEQIAIADYLDKACKRIDKIIKIKEEQIDFNKLNFESKIHELVTKGLGKKEFLNSSSQTIGKHPKDWRISKLKNHCRIYPSNVDKKSFDNEIPVKLCNYVDVYYNDFITTKLDFMEATAKASEIKKFQLKVGDVLVTKDSEDPMDIGVPALVEESFEKFVCGYHLSMIRCNGFSLIGEYLFWLLKNKSIASQLFREATGVTRWAIASRHFNNLEIPVPSIEEQKEISTKLKELSIKSKLIENNIKTQIQTLKDYRKSLIHECVTGKKQIVKAMETVNN